MSHTINELALAERWRELLPLARRYLRAVKLPPASDPLRKQVRADRENVRFELAWALLELRDLAAADTFIREWIASDVPSPRFSPMPYAVLAISELKAHRREPAKVAALRARELIAEADAALAAEINVDQLSDAPDVMFSENDLMARLQVALPAVQAWLDAAILGPVAAAVLHGVNAGARF
jgi:hypothetical protein